MNYEQSIGVLIVYKYVTGVANVWLAVGTLSTELICFHAASNKC